ncbi:MAG TPA: hypothetical protein VMS37_09735 [Verrucomicrobiae bacterium]|nr:hypothetical protein [Verrucomicrobiae bacterium]
MRILGTVLLSWTIAAATFSQVAQSQPEASPPRDVTRVKGYGTHFQTSDRCVACHNGLTTPAGEDISIGINWRTSMMGNAGRDPYWMAGVRRETTDHAAVSKAIEDECTICHMPMMRYEARLAGGEGEVFSHVPPNPDKRADQFSDDGVSCSVCHQITEQGLGTRASFVGGFKIDETSQPGQRHEYGQFDTKKGHTTIMRSSVSFEPKENKKVIQSSELCATCHTLITSALDAQGKVIGELPEQVPYQEWLHSDYKETRSCQDCHMPRVKEDVPITSVFGEPRSGFSRHTFVGGNFFMQRILNRYRNDLGIPAQPNEMDAAVNRTIAHLQSEAAGVAIRNMNVANDRVSAEIEVTNRGGHKLPTAYPSRRVWLHVTLRDRNGSVVFDSGGFQPDGSIAGNDNDADSARFEPHYREITNPDQVQIYESVMADGNGRVTTGLLTALRFVKDNRLLPKGFDKRTATPDIAVHGEAETDADFDSGGDTVRYSMAAAGTQGPFRVEAELWYQPIAYRWAMNLNRYDATEPKRFVSYYVSLASTSGVILAHASATR